MVRFWVAGWYASGFLAAHVASFGYLYFIGSESNVRQGRSVRQGRLRIALAKGSGVQGDAVLAVGWHASRL